MAIELNTVTSGYNLSLINANFQTLEDYINQKLLARSETGVAGEAMMERDLDMNGHSILNADINSTNITNDRAIRVPASEGSIPPLPVAEDRKGKVLTFDQDGNVQLLFPATDSALDVRMDLNNPNDITLGDAMVAVKQPISGSFSTSQHVKNSEYISAWDLGILPNTLPGANASNNRARWHSAQAPISALNKTLYFPDGVYEFDNYLGISASGLKMEWAPGAQFKLLNGTYNPLNPSSQVGGFIILGYDGNLGATPVSDVHLVRPNIDCNLIVGENALSGVRCSKIIIDQPVLQNTRYTTAMGGGKALHFEGAIQEDICINRPVIKNCSLGIAMQGSPDGTKASRAISVLSPQMYNVDIPFMIYSQFASPDTNTPRTMSMYVTNATLHNCGAVTTGFASLTGGGVVCSDRGYGLYIDGIRVINEASYNGIGAFCRGQMFGVTIKNASIYHHSMTSIIDTTVPGFGNPAGSEFQSRIDADISAYANLDFVFKGASTGQYGVSNFKIKLDYAIATLAGICDANAGASNLAYAEIVDINTNKSTGYRALSNIYTASNSIGESRRYDARGTWTPVDASGAGLALTLNGTQLYTRIGDVVTCTLDITYPNTASTAAAAISGLPFVSATTAGGTAGTAVIGFTGVGTLARGNVAQNSQVLRFYTTTTNIQNTALAGTNIQATITYLVSA